MKIKVKAIFIDLDGTLLRTNGDISDKTASYIKKIKKSVFVILSTARPPRDTKFYYDLLRLNTPIINYNGAMIHNYNINFIDYCILNHQLRYLSKYLNEVDNFWIETKKGVYIKKIDLQIENWIKSGKMNPTMQGNKVYKYIDSDIYKILIKDYNKKEKYILPHNISMIISDSNSYWKELLNSNANKYNAMIFVCSLLHVPLQNVVAIGNDLNDYEMIKSSGFGIAMKNSVNLVKEIADYITDTNNDDGVYKILNKII